MCNQSKPDWETPFAVVCGKLYDPLERAFREKTWFVVQDGVIRERGNGDRPPDDLPVLNLADYCITPGFMDGHCHLMFPGDGRLPDAIIPHASREQLAAVVVRNLLKVARAGVTAVCDVGSMDTHLLELREHLVQTPPLMPRVIGSGAPLTPTGGHMAYLGGTADSVDEMLKKARLYRSRGAEILKIVGNGGGTPYTRAWVSYYAESDLRRLVEEAHSYDQVVAVHANHLDIIRKSVDARVDSLEHCSFATGPDRFDADPRLVNAIAEKEIWVTPTLLAVYGFIDVMQEKWPNLTPQEKALFQSITKLQEHNFKTAEKLYRAGVKFFIGTDAGWRYCRFGDYQWELALLRRIGFSVEDLLYAATLGVAKARGVGRRMGSLQKGSLADFAVFSLPHKGSAFEFPSNVRFTFVGGFPIYAETPLRFELNKR